LLFEHVDLLETDPLGLDAGFFAGLNTLRENTKRPIVLTCNDPHFLSELGEHFDPNEDIICFETVQEMIGVSTQSTVSDLRKFAKDFCHSENIAFNKDLDMLCHLVEGDTRKFLLLLQYWYQHDQQGAPNTKMTTAVKKISDGITTRSPLLSKILTSDTATSRTSPSNHHLCEKFLGVEVLSKLFQLLFRKESVTEIDMAPLKNDFLRSSQLCPLHQTFLAHLKEDGDMKRTNEILDILSEIDLVNGQRKREQESTDLDMEMSEPEVTLLHAMVKDIIFAPTHMHSTFDPKDDSVLYSSVGGSHSDTLHLESICIEDAIRTRLDAVHKQKVVHLVSKCIPIYVKPSLEEIHGVVRICLEEEKRRSKSTKRRFYHHLQNYYFAEDMHTLTKVGSYLNL